MEKVIFLDFDGVITVLETRWEPSEEHMRRVKRICDETGAKIVISSSWRWYSLDETFKRIYKRCPEINENHFLLNKDLCVGVTRRIGPGGRGDEIKDWLSEHPDVKKFVILDDDSFDMLPEQKPFLINTAWNIGIQDEDVEKAIKILTD